MNCSTGGVGGIIRREGRPVQQARSKGVCVCGGGGGEGANRAQTK